MKFISSFILSLCSVWSFSQTILYQAETTSRTVQDPEAVIMAQGFHAKSDVSNPFVAKLGPATDNPGGGPISSDAGANNPSGTTEGTVKFHDTKGNIEVNGAGQLQFTLPIALPPGVKSVAPQISLVYTSGSGNGIAGYGWNISGITSISRMGKNIEKDGELKGIQLDYSDYYSFNGQRLILKSGEYGKDGAEYVTEKYSNVKIKSVGNYLDIGPAHFEVTFEDGSQAWYGAYKPGGRSNPEVTTPLEYNIVKWKDSQGNYISYDYVSNANNGGFRISNRTMRISSIWWGGNETLNKPHFNSIEFTYIDRDFKEQSYIQGSEYTQNKILSEIKVVSNGNQFKKYIVDYFKNGTNYQFVNKITTYNADNNPANPVSFTYPTSTEPYLEYSPAPDNVDNFDKIKLTGDFNGDSYLDFVLDNGNVKLSAFNDSFTNIATNQTFNADAKVVNTLLDEEGQVHNGNGIVQYENGKVVGYIFRNNAFVKVFEKLVYDESKCTLSTTDPPPAGCKMLPPTLNEGDIDGDGISDIFLTLRQELCQWIPDPNCNNPNSSETANRRPEPCTLLRCNTYTVKNFIIDLKNSNNPLSTYTLDSGINENLYYNQQYIDVNKDSKIDVINISNTNYTVFEFIKESSNTYLKKIKFSGNLIEPKSSNTSVLFGDFNGDGILDFTIPTTDNQDRDNWRFYIGTGKGFNHFLKSNFIKYRKEGSTKGTLIDRYFYSISDTNRDGKSDIVSVYSYNEIGPTGNHRKFGYNISFFLANGSQSDSSLNFLESKTLKETHYTANVVDFEIFKPITAQIKANNNYYEVFLYWKERLHKLKAPLSLGSLSRIQSINQGGLTTYADYLEVVPDNSANPNFYKKNKKEYYPYLSLSRSDQSYTVAQLRQEGKKQDFRYRGMTAHLQGKGMIGYHQTARSSWYADGFENTKIWSGAEIDPLKEGVPVKEWSIRTNEETNIFPADISENNSQLLSFKSTLYQTDELLNGQVATSVASSDKPKIVTALLPKSIRTKDFLTGTVSENTITYGDYYLPAQSVSNVNNGYATTTSAFEYIHNPSGTGAEYYIGRPKTKTDVIQAYGDTKSAKEEYTYENNQLKTLKNWNRDNTGYLLDTYEYDGFGNIVQKLTSNSIDSQTQTAKTTYDPQGKFVIKKTDNLGLETIIEYNERGQIKKQTDPLGNTLENTYDSWGKLLTSKTNLGGTTTYAYVKDNNSNISITQYDPDGDISKKYTNKLGQEYKKVTKSFGQNIYIATYSVYDPLGRKIRETEPYFENGAEVPNDTKWNVNIYDDSVYPARVTSKGLAKINTQGLITSFSGKEITASVSGNTTSVQENNGYGRLNTKTTDALGNVITTTDKGGSIQFSYNSAGEQIKAQYAENIVTTEYDAWGRKSKFNDPSNGLYQYEYNGFGQPTKTISPKGTKEYSYNTLGQLISQKELSTTDGGSATNKTISFTYDSKGRVISKTGTSKGKAYSSNVSYDPQGRLLSSSESSNGKYFIRKGITYDDKARVISFEKQVYSSGVLIKVQVENNYSTWNGELYQVKDKNSGKILWELNETNAKGQVLTAKLGTSQITNTYDGNGFLQTVNHSSPVKAGILQLSYSFDAIRNELKSRKTGGDFNINEFFDYDDNNRLVNWTDPVTGIKPQPNRNVYDVKGRILENDQVGKIKFDNSAKIYQPTGMTLNAAGTQNYNNDLIQSISYNENNDPVFIDGEKGDVAFQYGLTAMRQQVTYGGNFGSDQQGQFTKFYSEDGSFEVIKNNVTGQEKHILYIGGTPYESNIVYLKDFTESSGSYKFLHKDYIGSILAISDEAGNKLEQRHFDAWGNFTHLQIGSGAIITDKVAILNAAKNLIIDRGYTSHEHFAEVGIIHMNGRLYDPLLRRFLNADENIQDPTNTQIYNKYGYAINNPLMYNDPSGEFWEAGLFLTILAYALPAAAIGAAISAGIYIIQATINNNWTLGGFVKSILIGAVTGAVSAGIGQVFSTAGFWATAGVGALSGGATGGITALITGDNFLQGVLKGAVIGGAVAAVSYSINYFISNKSMTSYMEASDESILSDGTPVGNRSYARELYKSQFEQQSGLSSNDIYNRAQPGGTMNSKTGFIEYYKKGKKIEAWGVTQTKKDYISGKIKSKIYLSNKAFGSREQLSYVLQHELNHVRLEWSSMAGASESSISFKPDEPAFKYRGNLDNVGHYYIQESGTNFIINNGWQNLLDHIPERVFNTLWYHDFNESIKKLLIGTDKKININFK